MAALGPQRTATDMAMAEPQNRLICELLKANTRPKVASAAGVVLDNAVFLEGHESVCPSLPEPQCTGEASDVKVSTDHAMKEDTAPTLDVALTEMPCFSSSSTEGPSGALVQTTGSFPKDARQSPFEKGTAKPLKEEPSSTIEYHTPPVPVQMVHSISQGRNTDNVLGGGEANFDVQLSLPGMSLFFKLTETFPRSLGSARFISWTDGSFYFGQLSGDTLDGLGVYRYPDGSVYCGEWRADRLQGNGSFMTPNGFLYRGQFEDDKQHGAGAFILPSGRTFFGFFRQGKLHGFSCCVARGANPMLGEWHDGEFQRALPIQQRVAEFYVRAAETVDLLETIWAPLAVPMPHAGCAAPDDPALGSRGSPAADGRETEWKSRFPRGSVLEALGTELPTSLLQSAAAASSLQETQVSSLVERTNAAKTPCVATPKQAVRKRKASAPAIRPTPAARECRLENSPAKLRAVSGVAAPTVAPLSPQSSTAAPPRATTTKAQLLRWDTEARKLPRIPHLNYNRVLGRWYARVRDPASGRRIWKGYTCAVHGFYQARDMAIDRLRQFSQLVAPSEALLHTASSASDGLDCVQSPLPECTDTPEAALLSESRNSFEAPEFPSDELNPTVNEVDAILKAGMDISEASEKAAVAEECAVGPLADEDASADLTETALQVATPLGPRKEVRSGLLSESVNSGVEQSLAEEERNLVASCQGSTSIADCPLGRPPAETTETPHLTDRVERHTCRDSSGVAITLTENGASSRLTTADSLDVGIGYKGPNEALKELNVT